MKKVSVYILFGCGEWSLRTCIIRQMEQLKKYILSILQYENEEQATATRAALHGTTWPQSNPKILKVEYASKDEVINYPLLITLCACSNKKTFFSVKTLTTFLMF